jgi:hypothetical protein
MGPGSHVGFPISAKNTSLVYDHPMNISAKFDSNLFCGFRKKAFFLKPQNRFEPNLAEMFIGWSYTRLVFLVLIGNPTWLPGPIMCSDWWSYVKTMFADGCHLGWRSGSQDIILKVDHLRTIHPMFALN